ncbi:MAG: hypothetical protein ACIALR_01425 [Blastopirellula sp. JB062]
MATKIFRGDAVAVAQVDTVQVTAFDAATTYSLTVNGKSVSVAGDTNVNDTAAALAAAWNASEIAEMTEVTAEASTDTVTLTGDVKGRPHTIASNASGGTGTIGNVTLAAAADGPNVWSAANFGGSLPANDDDVVLQGGVSVLYGLDQSAVTLDSLTIAADATGAPTVGLTRYNPGSNYLEYRPRYLAIGADAIKIGNDSGAAVQRCQIDTGSVEAAITVSKGSVKLAGSHASNSLEVTGGDVSLAIEPGQAAQFATVAVSGSGRVISSETVTLGTVRAYGNGASKFSSAITTLELSDLPNVVVDGAGAIATANVYSGTLDYRSSGTITQLNGGADGTLDARNNLSGCTITDGELAAGFTIEDGNGRITWTNAYTIPNGALQDVTHNTGRNATVKAAIA